MARRNQTPGEYDRAQKRMAQRQVRAVIDAATPATFSGDVHPRDVVMVSNDVRQEQAGDTSADPIKPLAILAQIPPFRVGRVTYRVIAERINEQGNGEVAVICRTRPSTLYQHASNCSCAPCGYLPEWCDANGRTSRDLWYHDATRTWHLRVEHGTWTYLGVTYAEQARMWAYRGNGATPINSTRDGRIQ